MSKIVINDVEYTDDVDKRFAGCEFCDVRSRDYYYYMHHCMCAYSADDKPCGNARYLKRVDAKTKDFEKGYEQAEKDIVDEGEKISREIGEKLGKQLGEIIVEGLKEEYKKGYEQMQKDYAELTRLADSMYEAAAYLTTDASRLGEAMRKYNQYKITHNG